MCMLVHYIPKIIFFLKKALSGAPPSQFTWLLLEGLMPWALPGRLAALPGREGPALPGREGPALPGRFFSADCLLKCNTGNSVAVHHSTVWYKDPQLLVLYLSLKILLFFLGLPNYWCSIYTGRVVLLDRFSRCGLPCWGENTKKIFFAYKMQKFENR